MLKSYYRNNQVEAGCDEAGRGCLAGPVVAAAVILPPKYRNKKINDSKQIPEKTRFALAEVIKNDALAWAVSVVSHTEIDQINFWIWPPRRTSTVVCAGINGWKFA